MAQWYKESIISNIDQDNENAISAFYTALQLLLSCATKIITVK